MVDIVGECKGAMEIKQIGQWGYHPLVVSLSNTGEPLFLVNRSGDRPSHEHAGEYLDLAVELCRKAGFRRIKLRGDTDFSQTARLDGWDDRGVRFVFGIDAMKNLYHIAESLPENAWQKLERPARHDPSAKPRQRPENVKQQVVIRREFEDIRLIEEQVAEFDYQPEKCRRPYRVVVVRKDLVQAVKGNAVVPSYVLPLTVTVAVRSTAVMSAESEGWVSV